MWRTEGAMGQNEKKELKQKSLIIYCRSLNCKKKFHRMKRINYRQIPFDAVPFAGIVRSVLLPPSRCRRCRRCLCGCVWIIFSLSPHLLRFPPRALDLFIRMPINEFAEIFGPFGWWRRFSIIYHIGRSLSNIHTCMACGLFYENWLLPKCYL